MLAVINLRMNRLARDGTCGDGRSWTVVRPLLDAVRRLGRVVVVGLGTKTTTFSNGSLIRKSVELRGSYGASKDEYRQVLGFIAEGRITPIMEEIPFADLNKGLDRLRHGKVRGRLVTRPGD